MNSIKLFRLITLLEGLSLIILLGVAMPMKYIYDAPEMVRIVGMFHGVLFLAYVAFAVVYKTTSNWNFKDFTIIILASIVPFGTFYIDNKYLKVMQ